MLHLGVGVPCVKKLSKPVFQNMDTVQEQLNDLPDESLLSVTLDI
jgi:hypothetical protein